MDALQRLKLEADQIRIYRTESNHCDYLDWHVNDFKLRHPGHPWEEHCRIVAGDPRKGSYDVAVKHMIQWGKADARVIEDAFGLSLPASVHEFYNEIQEAVLLWKNVFHILNPADAVAWEKEYRLLSEEEALPVRMIRFCKLDASGDSIALHFNERTGKWRVRYAAVCDSTEELQAEHFDSECLAQSFDEWLQFLLDHDGLITLDEHQWLERVG